MRPRLKDAVWQRRGGDLLVTYDVREGLLLPDPDGTVERLFGLLAAGGRTVPELAGALGLAAGDVAEAVAALDTVRLLEDGDVPPADPRWAERHHSNLAFFESFATLERGRAAYVRDLAGRHVLVLGTGGLNSNVLPHLCGLGVGAVTLLDRDAVEPRNFARQYLYRESDLGARKVDRAADWVRAFDPSIRVATVDTAVTGADQLLDLLAEVRPDAVAAGIDQPDEVDQWVNAACVRHGVPFVRGGMGVTEGSVRSVWPGVSGCLTCLERQDPGDPDDLQLATETLYRRKARINRGIGPVAGLLGALCAFELLRYLSGFEPPAYAGRTLVLDFAAGCATREVPWARDPGCSVCAGVPDPTAPAGAVAGSPAAEEVRT